MRKFQPKLNSKQIYTINEQQKQQGDDYLSLAKCVCVCSKYIRSCARYNRSRQNELNFNTIHAASQSSYEFKCEIALLYLISVASAYRT